MAIEGLDSQFSGWALIEIMGRDRAAGFVTTEYFGSACLFRVDTPALPEREFVLKSPEYVEHTWTPAGATVKRPESPARTRFLGPSSIFSLIPCTEEAARAAIEEIYPRPMILLKMPQQAQLNPSVSLGLVDPVCGSEIPSPMKAFSTEHDNVRYLFCSRDCMDQLQICPEDYIHAPGEEA